MTLEELIHPDDATALKAWKNSPAYFCRRRLKAAVSLRIRLEHCLKVDVQEELVPKRLL